MNSGYGRRTKQPLPKRLKIRPVRETARGDRHHFTFGVQQGYSRVHKGRILIASLDTHAPKGPSCRRCRVNLPVWWIHDDAIKAPPVLAYEKLWVERRLGTAQEV